ncbi:hypothetical protein D9756_010049 [Leucocoprinus leucothites]|uniref:Uncharacterized protein n=1 Tax=Leucocoprinus leucothites TaxID=201217 RepID=A0A8H5FRI2_9AGAR|nr:hypothetical protein D9756_010049 [Leucoagaricus leucothites]
MSLLLSRRTLDSNGQQTLKPSYANLLATSASLLTLIDRSSRFRISEYNGPILQSPCLCDVHFTLPTALVRNDMMSRSTVGIAIISLVPDSDGRVVSGQIT